MRPIAVEEAMKHAHDHAHRIEPADRAGGPPQAGARGYDLHSLPFAEGGGRHLALLCLAIVAMPLACVIPAPPGSLDLSHAVIHSIEGGSVELLGKFAMKGSHVVPLGVGSLSLDEDEYTTAIITGLAEQLRKHGIRVETGADRRIEIQVVQILIHPKPQFTCVIDFNRKLGSGRVRGLQSRAESWNSGKVCSAAASQIVIDTLNDPVLRDYLKGA